MTLEKLYTDLKEAFTGKTAEVEAKAGEVASLTAKVAEMTAALSSKEAAFIELAAQAKDMSDKLASAEAFAKKAQEDVARIAAAQETAGKKAANIVADAGVLPVEVTPGEATAAAKSDDEVVAEWSAMKMGTKEKQAFFDRNKASILRVLKLA
jgi:chromosome segregation ATPase